MSKSRSSTPASFPIPLPLSYISNPSHLGIGVRTPLTADPTKFRVHEQCISNEVMARMSSCPTAQPSNAQSLTGHQDQASLDCGFFKNGPYKFRPWSLAKSQESNAEWTFLNGPVQDITVKGDPIFTHSTESDPDVKAWRMASVGRAGRPLRCRLFNLTVAQDARLVPKSTAKPVTGSRTGTAFNKKHQSLSVLKRYHN
ncbi:hypothetical protein GJ744_005782 [Endocarpon pusillum]|uniref:Uncharacterized protein n=1 Tax=Endocarpon pusillum TaxID=364733 RepID=A0A8H7AQ57_9EURO|nr:hypothetical protein GJ744_005782 [Endocarpon pusillum]